MLERRRLYLMRHARPLPAGPGPDLTRELSPEGWRQARLVGESLRGERWPGALLSSPATRCQQTAQGIIEGLEMPSGMPLAGAISVSVRAELGMDDPAMDLEEFFGAGPCALVVSHEPTLLSLGLAILGAAAPPLHLRPAQVAWLLEETGAWRLERVVDPPSFGGA